MKLLKATTIFALSASLCLASAIIYRLLPSSTFAFSQPLLPKPIPAFYTGGLEQGSGGQLERDWQAYNSSNLFAPSRAQNSANALMPNSAYPSPESCGSCHTEIYQNWQQSLHASSATDEAYLAVKELFAFERGEPAVRLCAGCHAPVALMTGEVGLYNRESASSRQGVSCAFCHTVDASHGGNGAYTSNPSRVRAYLGVPWSNFHTSTTSSSTTSSSTPVSSSAPSSPLEGVAKWLVYQKPDAHKEDMRSPALATGQVCQSCHQFTINGVAVQDTWNEWKTSSFARQGTTCQSCHFSASGDPKRLEPGEIATGRSRNHVWKHALGGGSTTVAGRASSNVTYLKNSLQLEAKRSDSKLEIKVSNIGAGHSIPTGVTDLRELWLEVTAFDARGKTVFSSGVQDAAGVLPRDTRLFHATLLDARDRKLEQHDIWRVAKLGSDTRIPANGSRLERFTLPREATRVQVRLLWRDFPATFVSTVLKKNPASLKTHELHRWETK
jgi:Cytochrome c554 and c-prime